MTEPLLIAHRGRSAIRPENTTAAFVDALETEPPADGVEFDVLLTADGVPIVFHDEVLARLTGALGRVDAVDHQTIAQLRVQGEPIPTLAAALAAIAAAAGRAPHAITVNVELKTTPQPQRLVDACAPHLVAFASTGAGALVVSSFDPRTLLAAIRRAIPARLALLYHDPEALRALPHLADAAVIDLHPRHDLATEAHLGRFAAPGRAFRVWTVDDPVEATRVASLDIAAIICNDPQTLRAAMRASRTATTGDAS